MISTFKSLARLSTEPLPPGAGGGYMNSDGELYPKVGVGRGGGQQSVRWPKGGRGEGEITGLNKNK